MAPPRTAVRNDPRQYDALAGEWWRPGGLFELLHWLAAARAELIPPASRDGAVLVDVGCGAGLLAPHVAGHGYRHVGVDLSAAALAQARARGVTPVRADAARLPLPVAVADVVVAGELLEHVPDLPATVAELCRVLRPGGLLVLDTLNDTPLSRLLTITVAEFLVPRSRGIHDPAFYVDPARLTELCATHGVRLRIRGIRPSLPALAGWLLGRRPPERARRMRPIRSTAVAYQGMGRKEW
ncbi:2-polyprenyl-6-hydroxyphenyl methylase/3-demethylubiquinone-9 3-methyltransferase [Catenuloplanes nepalensis]|uniref:2-polyprenyl-6-hydroxyphenyl methylase/3-demethylubiquinone-9 3-methyltransferase n=1 Tax=Catenuloplanes nepalensis TaxID=587533 RepID=A0ABT9N3C6_9ACTN|nr:methyltransferase domain-containing protein [Catenuloplanes nepalensis]MDP9798205.1 2-polyprenyl-6-hydroxyphenyl methylase/3-demethylubiquinone-9 3-methyltransferase [Catenuloplanes nepalensis]